MKLTVIRRRYGMGDSQVPLTWGILLVSLILTAGMSGSVRASGRQDRDIPNPLQHTVASKTAKFGSVSKTDEIYAGAMDAHDLDGAYKKIGQKGSFKGTVSKVFEERDGDLVILDFDPRYQTALTAVLKNADFPKFPDIKILEGKEIVVSGSFVNYRGRAEIMLSEPGQINIVQ